MYNCLYHVESVGKAVSLREAKRRVVIRLFQLTRHDTNSYLKKSKQRGAIVYVTSIVTSRHSNNSKIHTD